VQGECIVSLTNQAKKEELDKSEKKKQNENEY
jgi:hypothetical protein